MHVYHGGMDVNMYAHACVVTQYNLSRVFVRSSLLCALLIMRNRPECNKRCEPTELYEQVEAVTLNRSSQSEDRYIESSFSGQAPMATVATSDANKTVSQEKKTICHFGYLDPPPSSPVYWWCLWWL